MINDLINNIVMRRMLTLENIGQKSAKILLLYDLIVTEIKKIIFRFIPIIYNVSSVK